jgi:hypothetical protein
MAFSTGQTPSERSLCGECLAGQRSASASATESRPTPQAAEVIPSRRWSLSFSTPSRLEGKAERGSEADPKAGDENQGQKF